MILDDLKAKIERIEGRTKRFVGAGEARPAPWQLGLDSLDAALPVHDKANNVCALPYNACHDFTPLVKSDVPQVAGFIAALLQRLPASRLQRGPIVWCQTRVNAREYGRIYAPGLLGSALSPDRLLLVSG